MEQRVPGGSKTLAQGVNFLSDTEYLGTTSPSPAYKDTHPHVNKLYLLN